MRKVSAPRIVFFILLFFVSLDLFLRYLNLSHLSSSQVPLDFNVYATARDYLRRHLDPYSFMINKDSAYKYSPIFIVPFLALPASHGLTWVISKLLLVVLIASAVLVGTRIEDWNDVVLFVLSVLICWRGLIETLTIGQMEPVLLFLFVLATRCLRRRPFLSGFLVALTPAIKLPWIILALPLMCYLYIEARDKLVKFVTGGIFGALCWSAILPCSFSAPDSSFN